MPAEFRDPVGKPYSRPGSPERTCSNGPCMPAPTTEFRSFVHCLVLAGALALSACATYRPMPLATDAGMPHQTLNDAAALPPATHPRLAPAKLVLDQPLDELDVARLALLLNPDLRAQRSQVGIADAQLFAAGLLPDPQISLAVDVPDTSGLVRALTAGLGIDLASLVSRPAARDAGRHALEKVRLDVAWSEWLVINQVRTLCRRIHFLEQQVTIAERATEATHRLFELSAQNKSRGDARLDETTVYQVGFIDAQNRSLALHRDLVQATFQLKGLLGLAPDVELTLAPPAPAEPAHVDSDALLHEAIGQRLDLAALREGYQAQESELRRAVSASIPVPQLSWNRARDTGAVWTHGVAASFSLPIWNRGRGEIRIASSTRDQLAAEYTARVYQAGMDIASAASDLEAIEAQRAALSRELPSLVAASSVLDKAARDGNVPLLTSETARAALLDKQLVLSSLEQAQAEGEVALDAAVGRLSANPETNSEDEGR